MYLFKNLNRTIYILFFTGAFLIFFNNQVQAISITSNANPSGVGQQVGFTNIVQVTGLGTTPDILSVFIDYGDGTSEETLYSQNPTSPNTVTITSNHTYSLPGSYTVRLRATVTVGSFAIVGPNPAVMTQRVKGVEIRRLQLYFENNRPEITIKRNQKPPKLSAKIDFTGTGYLKGYWEIDGTRKSYVFKYLSKGPSVILKYPAVPPIPTFKFGTHNVRFIITDPAMNINFPYGIYFVTSDAKKEPVVISLLEPVEGEDVAYRPFTFKWKPVNKASIYLISIFSKTKEERRFSAYTRQGEYILRPNTLKLHMKPGEEYYWNVVGFNDENEVTAESIPSVFSFN
jgi:hypothetical protein